MKAVRGRYPAYGLLHFPSSHPEPASSLREEYAPATVHVKRMVMASYKGKVHMLLRRHAHQCLQDIRNRSYFRTSGLTASVSSSRTAEYSIF